MEWNEATGTNQVPLTYDLDLQTPTDGFTSPGFPLKDPHYWIYNEQSQTTVPPAEMPKDDGGNASTENNSGLSLALSLALLLSLTSLITTSGKSTVPHPPPPPVEKPKEKTKIDECIEQFGFSVENLQTAWEASSPTVRDAFKHNFTPIEKEGVYTKEDNIWDMLEAQKNIFLKSRPSEEESEEKKEAYLKQEDRDSEDEGYSDNEDEEGAVGGKQEAVISLETAAKLVDIIRIEDIQSEDDLYICEHFDSFASIFGLRLATMKPGDEKTAASFQTIDDHAPFHTSDFLKFLKYRYERACDGYLDPRVFKYLARNWNEKHASEIIEQILDDQSRRTQDSVQQKVMTVLTVSSEQNEVENTLLLLSVFLL
ncbi:uncharacterized protein EMH_0002510 [Eimeria mitis]|uniref:Uncharacterized protein n=1 Tax=Eimeria mitis TaxID=44415 RepID=U6JU47_9EIME|nr:uncharacterized protein EMH_0002510 [Eimeria mitis]CDJ28914.1 hypothetical protein, conserved [Eimeria mitis]